MVHWWLCQWTSEIKKSGQATKHCQYIDCYVLPVVCLSARAQYMDQWGYCQYIDQAGSHIIAHWHEEGPPICFDQGHGAWHQQPKGHRKHHWKLESLPHTGWLEHIAPVQSLCIFACASQKLGNAQRGHKEAGHRHPYPCAFAPWNRLWDAKWHSPEDHDPKTLPKSSSTLPHLFLLWSPPTSFQPIQHCWALTGWQLLMAKMTSQPQPRVVEANRNSNFGIALFSCPVCLVASLANSFRYQQGVPKRKWPTFDQICCARWPTAWRTKTRLCQVRVWLNDSAQASCDQWCFAFPKRQQLTSRMTPCLLWSQPRTGSTCWTLLCLVSKHVSNFDPELWCCI